MEENKKEVAIDMDKVIIRVYNKIAIWNNQEVSTEEKTIMLKVLAHDIVSDVISTAFSQLEGARVKERVIPGVPDAKPKKFFARIFGGNK